MIQQAAGDVKRQQEGLHLVGCSPNDPDQGWRRRRHEQLVYRFHDFFGIQRRGVVIPEVVVGRHDKPFLGLVLRLQA